MPRVAKLSGVSPATQPRKDELVGDYRVRLAEELGVKPECVGFLCGKATVPTSTELSRYGSEEVLQVIVCPPDETICGWTVGMLLNELCVAGAKPNASLADERLAAVEIQQAEELKNAIQKIMSRALEEPKYYKQCADVVVALNARWPELPSEAAESSEGEANPNTFKGELVSALVKQFGVLRQSKPLQEDAGKQDAEALDAAHHQRALALMAFFGQLFVRDVVDMKFLCVELHELVGRDENVPRDHQMECAVELLNVAGPHLDAVTSGRPVMNHWLDRIFNIASWSEQNGAGLFSQPVLQKAEDLITLRQRNWGKAVAGFA